MSMTISMAISTSTMKGQDRVAWRADDSVELVIIGYNFWDCVGGDLQNNHGMTMGIT